MKKTYKPESEPHYPYELKKSPHVYQHLKLVFSLPSVTTLLRTFQPGVQAWEERLTNLSFIDSTFSHLNRTLYYGLLKIPSCLIVDAFSISTISPYNLVKFTDDEKNNSFYF